MSSRDEILASIRANRPQVERPLPFVPLFDDKPPPSLLPAFKDSLHRMGGVFLDAPEAGDVLAPIRTKIANAKVICSTVPEIAGNRDIAGIAVPQQLACPRCFRGRRNRFGAALRWRPAHQRSCLSSAASDRAARSRRHRDQSPPRLPPAGIPRRPLCLFSYRPIGNGRHRGCSHPRRPGRALAFRPACRKGRQITPAIQPER
jgi:hypothetical protein